MGKTHKQIRKKKIKQGALAVPLDPADIKLNRAVRHKDYRAVDERQFASPTRGLENIPDGLVRWIQQ